MCRDYGRVRVGEQGGQGRAGRRRKRGSREGRGATLDEESELVVCVFGASPRGGREGGKQFVAGQKEG